MSCSSDDEDGDDTFFDEELELSEDQLQQLTQQLASTQGFFFGEQEDDNEPNDGDCEQEAEAEGDNATDTRYLLSQAYLSQRESLSQENEDEVEEEQKQQLTEKLQYTNKRGFQEELPKDSEDRVYLDVDGEFRVFKKGESFHYNPPDRKFLTGREIYTIQEFKMFQRNKIALCVVSIPLEDTELGKKQSNRIKESALKTEYVQLSYNQKARLKYLVNRCNKQPRTSLTYDRPSKLAKGVGWTFSIHNHDCPKIKIPVFDSQPTALDLFAGAGGFSTGMQEAGLEVKVCVDKDPNVVGTLTVNHRSAEVYNEDANLFLDRVEAEDPGYPSKFTDDRTPRFRHLHVSSPCCGFSGANIYGGEMDKENNALCDVFAKGLKICHSDTGSFENVPGMVTKKHFKYVQKMIADLLLLEYQVRVAS